MLPLLGGVAILCGLLLLGYLFVNANPTRLARTLKWTAIMVAALVVVALRLAEGHALRCFCADRSLCCRLCAGCARCCTGSAARRPRATRPSTPRFIRMSLDHDTGAMSGTVLQGRFAGMRLEELRRRRSAGIAARVPAEDEEAARLIEAYLDRGRSNWRDEMAGERAGAAAAERPRRHGRGGLCDSRPRPGADAEAIKAAHHRLMKQLHPDHGGTDYLATKINRARDVLLHR